MNVDADTPATAPDTTPTDLAADALSAMDAGIAAADAEEQPPVQPAAADTVQPADAAAPAADDANAVPPADAQPPAQPQDGATPADGQPPAAVDDEQQPDADTEAEITALGLKEKSAERFRGMAAEIKQSRATVDALKAAGIEDVATLPALVERSKVGEDMVQMVLDTGMNSDQYGMLLDYGGLIAKATNGDLKAAADAFDMITKEIAPLAKMLGREVPGMHDPLANHQDLRAEVEAGDLPRARAVEIAGQRDRAAYTGSVERQRTDSQQAAEQARQEAFAGLQAYDAEMTATDPSYLAKRDMLQVHVNKIMASYPPREWERRTAIAYSGITLPDQAASTAAPAGPAQPRPGPMRPSGPRPAMAPQAFDNPMDAMNFGIEQAGQG